MNLFDLVATLRLDSTQYEAGVTSADESAGGFFKKFLNWKTIAVGAFTAVSAVAIKFGKDAVGVGMEFDKSMSQVGATMGAKANEMMEYNGKTMTQIEALTDFAKEMGATTAFSATQASEGLNYMALAGYDAETSIKMLPNVLNLASAGAMDLGRASDMLTDTQSALGLTLPETTELVDKMAVTASSSNTSVEQLGDAMLRVGGTAKSMKGGTTELASALGILADNGTKGAEGGTALRNVLLGIQGKKFEKTFGALGVSAYDSEGNLRSLKDVLSDMNSVMEGMSSEEKTKLITNTFNKADLKNVNALLDTTTDRWDELTEAIENSQGSAEEMAKTQLDNLAGDVTMFQSALEGVQIALSDKVTPSLRKLVQFGTSGLETLKKAFDEPSKALETLGEWFGKVGEQAFNKLSEIAENGPSIIASVLEKITGYLSEHSGDLISKGWDLLMSLIKGIIKALPSLGRTAVTLVKTIVSGIGQVIGLIWNTGVNLASRFGDSIKGQAHNLGVKVRQFAMNIPKYIKSAITGLWGIGRNIVSGLWEGMKDSLGWIKSLISGWVGNVKGFLKSLFGIASPSKWARKVIGQNIGRGVGLGIADEEGFVQDSFDSIIPDYEGGYSSPIRATDTSYGTVINMVNNITVDGAENPEDFADRFVRQLRIDMRTV